MRALARYGVGRKVKLERIGVDNGVGDRGNSIDRYFGYINTGRVGSKG